MSLFKPQGGFGHLFNPKRRKQLLNYAIMGAFFVLSGLAATRYPQLLTALSWEVLILPVVSAFIGLSSWGNIKMGPQRRFSVPVFVGLTWLSYVVWLGLMLIVFRMLFAYGPAPVLAFTNEYYEADLPILSISASYFPPIFFSLWAVFIGVVHFHQKKTPSAAHLAATLYPKAWIGPSQRFATMLISLVTTNAFQWMVASLIIALVLTAEFLFLDFHYIQAAPLFLLLTMILIGFIIYPPWRKILRKRQSRGLGLVKPLAFFITTCCAATLVFSYHMSGVELPSMDSEMLDMLISMNPLPVVDRLKWTVAGLVVMFTPLMGSAWAYVGQGYNLRSWWLVHSAPAWFVVAWFYCVPGSQPLDDFFRWSLELNSFVGFFALTLLLLVSVFWIARYLRTSAFFFTGFMVTRDIPSYGMSRFAPNMALGVVLSLQAHALGGWLFMGAFYTALGLLMGWLILVGVVSVVVQLARDYPLTTVFNNKTPSFSRTETKITPLP